MKGTILGSMIAGALVVAAGCGGGNKADSSGRTTPGNSHVADDLDVPDEAAPTSDAGAAGATTSDPVASSTVDAGAAVAPPASGSLVTFRLSNTSSEELDFAIDKGWQGNIFAYTGVPPKAKSVVLFAKHCTAACDAPAADRCPYCPPPKRNRDEKAAEKRVTVAAGAHHDVPWDGKIYVYEKTRGTRNGRRARCSCYKTVDIPKAEYTVKACGLRVTKKAGKRSRYECPTLKVTLPPDSPTVITFEYPGK